MLLGTIYAVLVLMAIVLAVFVMCQKTGMSLALGYLLSGIVLGPLALGILSKNALLIGMSQIGLLLFLFAVGLEIPFPRIRALQRLILGFGLMQVLFSALVLSIVLHFWMTWSLAIIIGITLSFSSTAVVIQLLSEKHELTSYTGRVALSILLFQDIVAIVLFMVLGLVNQSSLGWKDLSISALGLFLTVLAGIVITKVTERSLAFYKHSEFITALVMFSVLALSLLTEVCHLSYELGAFVVGVAMASTQWKHQISAEFHAVRTLFLAIFFISMGLEIQMWPTLRDTLWILLSLVAISGLKMFVVTALAWRLGRKKALRLGVLMSGCSEFLFIVLPLLPQLNQAWYNNLLMMCFISMIATPLLFALFRQDNVAPCDDALVKEKHSVIVAGFGDAGQTISRILENNFIPFLVLDYDGGHVERAQNLQYHVVQGDVRDIDLLKRMNIHQAKVLLITFEQPVYTADLVRSLRRKFPDLAICVQVRDYSEASCFAGLGVHVIVPEPVESGVHMASVALQYLGFSSDHAQKMSCFPQKPVFFGGHQ